MAADSRTRIEQAAESVGFSRVLEKPLVLGLAHRLSSLSRRPMMCLTMSPPKPVRRLPSSLGQSGPTRAQECRVGQDAITPRRSGPGSPDRGLPRPRLGQGGMCPPRPGPARWPRSLRPPAVVRGPEVIGERRPGGRHACTSRGSHATMLRPVLLRAIRPALDPADGHDPADQPVGGDRRPSAREGP